MSGGSGFGVAIRKRGQHCNLIRLRFRYCLSASARASQVVRLEHVDEQALDADRADGFAEEHVLDRLRAHLAQRRKQKENLAEAEWLVGVGRLDVTTQTDLRLILQCCDALHLSQSVRRLRSGCRCFLFLRLQIYKTNRS